MNAPDASTAMVVDPSSGGTVVVVGDSATPVGNSPVAGDACEQPAASADVVLLAAQEAQDAMRPMTKC